MRESKDEWFCIHTKKEEKRKSYRLAYEAVWDVCVRCVCEMCMWAEGLTDGMPKKKGYSWLEKESTPSFRWYNSLKPFKIYATQL